MQATLPRVHRESKALAQATVVVWQFIVLKTTIAKCVMSTFHQMLTGNKMDVWLWDWRIIRFPCQRKQRLKKKKRNKRLRINDVHGY